jgi:hypothetical protein
MFGGPGEDVIYGGDGNDFLAGSWDRGQRDKLYCGEGMDHYLADKNDYVDSSCEIKGGQEHLLTRRSIARSSAPYRPNFREFRTAEVPRTPTFYALR